MSTPCDDKRESETDDNERLMERCWREQYKGASRRWLIRDASTKLPQGPLCSTMKESYIYPERVNWGEENIGIRKKYLMNKFYEEAQAEVTKERETGQVTLDYCTEYDGNFRAEGFKPEDHFYRKNTEIFQKYPLYSSAPVSYYSFNQQKNPKEVLHGLTKVTDRQNIFKKNGQFSKPIGETFEIGEL